jgi:hypothetical protein
MASEISRIELARVRDWAKHQLATGRGQPWSAFLLTRLGETIDALLAGMAATGAEASPSGAPRQGGPRLVVCNAPCDSGMRTASRPGAPERPRAVTKGEPPASEPVT